jgi:hypothetical protein
MEQADESLGTADGMVQSVLAAHPHNRIAHDRMILAWWLKRPN